MIQLYFVLHNLVFLHPLETVSPPPSISSEEKRIEVVRIIPLASETIAHFWIGSGRIKLISGHRRHFTSILDVQSGKISRKVKSFEGRESASEIVIGSVLADANGKTWVGRYVWFNNRILGWTVINCKSNKAIKIVSNRDWTNSSPWSIGTWLRGTNKWLSYCWYEYDDCHSDYKVSHQGPKFKIGDTPLGLVQDGRLLSWRPQSSTAVGSLLIENFNEGHNSAQPFPSVLSKISSIEHVVLAPDGNNLVGLQTTRISDPTGQVHTEMVLIHTRVNDISHRLDHHVASTNVDTTTKTCAWSPDSSQFSIILGNRLYCFQISSHTQRH